MNKKVRDGFFKRFIRWNIFMSVTNKHPVRLFGTRNSEGLSYLIWKWSLDVFWHQLCLIAFFKKNILLLFLSKSRKGGGGHRRSPPPLCPDGSRCLLTSTLSSWSPFAVCLPFITKPFCVLKLKFNSIECNVQRQRRF